MNYDNYKTFIILSETMSFSRTAEKLNVVQSTVSNRMQELEKYLGKKLFTRSNKKVELTNAGKIFLPYAKRLILIEHEGLEKLRILTHYKDYLNIGAVDSIYRGFIPNIAKSYISKFTDTSLKITISHSNQILQLLSDGILDIGYVYIKSKSRKVESYVLGRQEIILVTHPNNQIYPGRISLKNLHNIQLLFADLGDIFNNWIFEIFPKNYTFHFHIDQISQMIEYLKAELGFAFVLRSSVEKELWKKELVEVKILDVSPPTIESYMVINKKRINALGVRQWLELVEK